MNSDVLLAKLGLADIGKVLSSRCLRWYGHAKRSQGCLYIVTDVLVEVDDDKKRPARPRKTCKLCVDSDTKACKLKDLDTLIEESCQG